MKLQGCTILVTGAAGGIGSATCSLLATKGARLILNGLQEDKLRDLALTLPGLHICVAADIAEAAGRETIVAACERAGGVDAVINLAGILDFGLYASQDGDAIEQLLRVNTIGPMLLTHALLPMLQARAQARILNVGSIFGSIGHPGFVAYCASKAALKTFSEALARELADTGVSVAYIAPRATVTALNGDRVMALQDALGNDYDPPALVATEIVDMLAGRDHERFLGWPEKLFVLLNALLPAVVHAALVRKLPLIKQHAQA
jgi:short-subunit dehydrogenase